MRNRILTLSLFFAALAATGFGQVLSNSSLTGKYFVRHVQFTTDANNNATDARSIFGTITFDGAGNYTIAGQQVVGTNPGTAFNFSGSYVMTPSGIVTLVNPQNTGLTINARFGTEAVVGSSTDAGTGIFDTFVAIPAPSTSAIPAFSNATLNAAFHMADFELTSAQTQQVRSTGMTAVLDGIGNVMKFAPLGHSAASGGNTISGQQFTGNYTVAPDGTGTMAFTAVAGTTGGPGPVLLQPNTRNLYVSATGNTFIAVLPGSHDLFLGTRNAATNNTNLNFTGRYWFNGFGVKSGELSQDFVASASVVPSVTSLLLSARDHQVPPIAASVPPLVNQTQTLAYAYLEAGLGNGCSCGIGTGGNVVVQGSNFLMLGAGGTMLGITTSVDVNGNANNDTVSYLILFGEQIPNLTGPGVFLNPQGIVNAATYSPVGDYVSPGEFIQLYGSGFVASGSMTASTLPFPQTLDGVSVAINGVRAPVYYVSPGEIICIVPYELTGTTATIVVTSGQTQSNSVTVGAQPSSPGIFSANDSGFGDGAITHVNNASVNSNSPAQPQETVQMYVSGLGALSTPVTDGNGAVGIDDAATKPQVYINGVQADVGYWGLTVDAGLYQINFTVPADTPNGEQSVIVFIPNGATGALTQTVTIAVQAQAVEAGI